MLFQMQQSPSCVKSSNLQRELSLPPLFAPSELWQTILCILKAYTQGMAASKSPVAMKRRSWEQNRLCEEWLSENKKINEQNIDGLIFVNKLFEDTLCRMATTSLNDNIGHRVNVVKILIVKIFFHSTFSFVLGDCLKLCLI